VELQTDHWGTDPQTSNAMPDMVRRANCCATSSHWWHMTYIGVYSAGREEGAHVIIVLLQLCDHHVGVTLHCLHLALMELLVTATQTLSVAQTS
jgi:hypothetical protein